MEKWIIIRSDVFVPSSRAYQLDNKFWVVSCAYIFNSENEAEEYVVSNSYLRGVKVIKIIIPEEFNNQIEIPAQRQITI